MVVGCGVCGRVVGMCGSGGVCGRVVWPRIVSILFLTLQL